MEVKEDMGVMQGSELCDRRLDRNECQETWGRACQGGHFKTAFRTQTHWMEPLTGTCLTKAPFHFEDQILQGTLVLHVITIPNALLPCTNIRYFEW
jgi:hypothetical protein